LINLSNSSELYQINENAFGFSKGFTNATYKLKNFYAEDCNVETFSPKLLNWAEMSLASITGNPLNCNEDMKWIVNDTQINLALQVGQSPRLAF
jgi:hypothetical protein